MTKKPEPNHKQPPESDISKIERAKNIAGHLLTALEALPDSPERTSATTKANEASVYINNLYEAENK
jgi:hypothetical protein